jgi:hypothetical protein
VLEFIGWGWDPGAGRAGEAPGLPQDPLAFTVPFAGPVVFYPNKRRLGLRYALFAGLSLAFFLTIVAKFTLKPFNLIDALFLVVYPMWLFSLSSIPLDIASFVEKADCREDVLEMTYWFRKKTVRFRWEEISELEYNYRAGLIRTEKNKNRFLLSEQSGFKEWKIVLATIVQRASLRFAETNFFKTSYRRYEAP